MSFSVAVTVALSPLRTRSSVTTATPPARPTICVSETRSQVSAPLRPLVSPKAIFAIASEPATKPIVPLLVSEPAGVEPSARFWSSRLRAAEAKSGSTVGPAPSVTVIVWLSLVVSPSASAADSEKLTLTPPALLRLLAAANDQLLSALTVSVPSASANTTFWPAESVSVCVVLPTVTFTVPTPSAPAASVQLPASV
ncbi:hypothetical protein BHMPCIPO_03730 [Ensifer sesbaniae]|nr:hypothetical protein [Ensifer sesbaniae]